MIKDLLFKLINNFVMKKVVIVCGELGYYYISGSIENDEFPLKDLILKYLDNKIGYFHFKDDISLHEETKVLEVLNGLYNSFQDELKPQLNKVNY